MKKNAWHSRFILNRAAAVALLVLLMQGCATLDKDQCMVADWRLIGYQDGVLGKSASTIGEYREDCAKHAVVPDLDAWRAGREQGLLEYCRPASAFRLGRSGRGYAAVCPEAMVGPFRAAYDDGRAIYLARSDVKDTHAQINRREHEIESLHVEKRNKLTELVQDGLHKKQRLLVLLEIHEIDEEINALVEEIDRLEHDLQVQQAYLSSLVSTQSY